MAASGYTPIQLYRTTTGAAVPTAANLLPGELGFNIADTDMALYAENASGTVKRIMNNPAGLKYPTADGTANQVVKTDGAGNLSFASPSDMVYPGAGIPNSTGTAWGTSYTTSGSGTVVVLATAPTLTDPEIVGTITEDVFALTDGATVDVDPGNGSIQTLTLTSTGRTLTFTNMNNGEAITLMINDGTAGTITTWNATFVNNGGSAPTLSTTGYTVVSVWKVAGVVYAALVGNA